MQTTSIKTATENHEGWKETLGFFKDELNIFKNRLTEVAAKNKGNKKKKSGDRRHIPGHIHNYLPLKNPCNTFT